MEIKSLSALLMVAAFSASSSAIADVRTSSQMIESNRPEGTYAAPNLVDGALDSVWIEGADGPGIGESFTLDLPRGEIEKVMIFPGHGASPHMYSKYSRLKEVSVSFFTIDDSRATKPVKQQNFVFEDAFKFQEVPIEEVKLGEELFGGQITVTIRSVYLGKDFRDTAVAEILVVLKEWPAQRGVSEVSSTLQGSDKENLVDDAAKTLWIADTSDAEPFVVLQAPDFGLSSLAISSGDPQAGAKFKEYARPKEIAVEIANHTVKYTLKDSAEPQKITLPTMYGYTGSMFGPLKVTVKSVYPGTKNKNLAIGEISLFATNFTL